MTVSDFASNHALVTGAASGIGRATALELAQLGAALTILDRDLDGLAATADAVRRAGATVRPHTLDVSNAAAVSRTMAAIEAETGSPEFVVNGAGVFFSGAIESIEDDTLQRCFAINAFGVVHVCRALLPGMMARGNGAIVNISSLHAQNGQPNASLYAAAKGAVMAFTKSLAREKARHGIRANVVAPGPIDTPFWRGAMVTDDPVAVIAQRVKTIPLGRLGQPQDVARVIVFLLSPAAAYMTGQVVTIGGGEIMP
jgi:NAD(P)-dependent dehydrogenase (short-subunit alcohol dehydrogenase family)